MHHVDDFTSPSLVECQDRSIVEPDHVLCVSQPWVERLRARVRRARRARLQRRRPAPLPAAARRAPSARARARRAGLGDRFAVLTVGGIEPRKGSLTLLEGFAAAARARCRERDRAADRRRHDAVRLPRTSSSASTRAPTSSASREHVRVLGALEPEAIERLFRAADVFAFPSVKEGFGLAALEALAAGLPVVASDIDVFRGFLADGESALLAPVGDARGAGRGARARGPRPALRDAAARAAAARSSPRYTWDASARRARARVRAASGRAWRDDALEVTAT